MISSTKINRQRFTRCVAWRVSSGATRGGTMATVVALAALLVLAGCASDGPPVSNPSGAVSGRKHQGPENEINLFRLFRAERGQSGAAEPVVGDPEYQEYLEWKRWREFKEYQQWQKEQDATSSQGS